MAVFSGLKNMFSKTPAIANESRRTWYSWLTDRFSNASVSHPGRWLIDLLGGNDSDSGIRVDVPTAMSYAPVWYAVNKIAGHIGQLPCTLYEELEPRNKQVARRHPAYWLISRRPNSWMHPMQFRETLSAHALLTGNGRALIVRNNRYEPSELIPIMPENCVSVLVNEQKFHVVTDSVTGEKTKFPDSEVVHITGISWNGISGMSVIDQMKNSIGLGLAGEKVGNRHFRNNSTPGIILEAPPGAFKREEDARKFLADWNSYHSGLENANKTAMLRDGIKATTLSTNARDAQWIEQRVFQRQDAALWFMLEQILGDDTSVSYNSLEQKNMAYLTNCLIKWLTKWEHELNTKLLTYNQQRSETHYFRFHVNSLLRGTALERFEVYSKARQMEVMSANDVREAEDMNAIPGGDSYANPSNKSYATPGSQDPSSQPQLQEPPPQEPTPPITAALTDPNTVIYTATLPQPQTNEKITRINRRLVESRFASLLEYERDRVVAAAGAEKNFLKWMEVFYSKDYFGGTLADVYSIMEAADICSEHIALSKQTLLDIAGRCGASNFSSTVEAELLSWKDRAGKIADVICAMEAAA